MEKRTKIKLENLIYLIETERNSRINRKDPSSRFVYNAYNNIISKLRESFGATENITSSKITKLHITDNMKGKLTQMIKKNPKKTTKNLRNELVKYKGLGKSKAQELINDGLTSVDQLHKKRWFEKLPKETQTFLKKNPVKIPNQDIKKLEPILTSTRVCKVVLVGSFRRETAFSKDIDIMLVSDKKDSMEKYLNYLKKKLKKIKKRDGVLLYKPLVIFPL